MLQSVVALPLGLALGRALAIVVAAFGMALLASSGTAYRAARTATATVLRRE